MTSQDLRHLDNAAPRIMVVDGSKLVRKLIGDVLARELADAVIVPCASIAEARAALAEGAVDLVTTSLVLPDGDGIGLAHAVRESAGQAYVPVIVVSGDAQSHLESRRFTEDVTDYFDKALGHNALAAFIRGYVQPQPIPGARVLYVEDSKVVALATKRMLERHGLQRAALHRRRRGARAPGSAPRPGRRRRRPGADRRLPEGRSSAATTCWRACATTSATASAACRCW